ncbi:lipopolysaccharide-induced tumor necrosis factor-alpha factor homolog [Neocloeon triangulifer]|uniref:lipopolysaccharide-induced tumor necrosis factor-alpha factor homolog n=1 Tax=Neocloeon triangulifer TaxID=2078957 RepID=UPI00286F20EE|nr:lipopolysaccharide-induced tumor necrosis factor-alpha factor homolog [Neocloeon triangulifer]
MEPHPKVVTSQPLFIQKPEPLPPVPYQRICPSCDHQVVTKVDYHPNAKTHFIATLLCCACCFIAWVPYCRNDCKEPHHFCPQCGAYLGHAAY